MKTSSFLFIFSLLNLLAPHGLRSLKNQRMRWQRGLAECLAPNARFMFSRKSVMQPRLLDLRDIGGNRSRMLHRLLGETITLEFHSPAQLPTVRADPSMIEQVVMNLAVNARDAMPKGGKLIIAPTAIEIDESYVAAHPKARPGRFVCLRVTDTGCGMDGATLERIFEPFFTTKAPGKGTGLGLATVYGIVEQHDGWVEVASQVGTGTTFSVFLPATRALPARRRVGAMAVGRSDQAAAPAPDRDRGVVRRAEPPGREGRGRTGPRRARAPCGRA